MPTIDQVIDGVRIERIVPAGGDLRPPLLFLHGLGDTAEVWRACGDWPGFHADRGFEVAIVDCYGRGGSAQLPLPERTTRGVLDVTRELDIACRYLARPPVVVAHSMGALAALGYASGARLATATGMVAGLVLLAPVPPRAITGGTSPYPFALEDLPITLTSDGLMTMPGGRGRNGGGSALVPESPVMVRELHNTAVDVGPLTRLPVPSMVVTGSRDILAPVDLTWQLADAIGAGFVVADGHGHELHRTGRWAEIAEQIDQWLSSTWAVGRSPGSRLPAVHQMAMSSSHPSTAA